VRLSSVWLQHPEDIAFGVLYVDEPAHARNLHLVQSYGASCRLHLFDKRVDIINSNRAHEGVHGLAARRRRTHSRCDAAVNSRPSSAGLIIAGRNHSIIAHLRAEVSYGPAKDAAIEALCGVKVLCVDFEVDNPVHRLPLYQTFSRTFTANPPGSTPSTSTDRTPSTDLTPHTRAAPRHSNPWMVSSSTGRVRTRREFGECRCFARRREA
jgi:hypothetical protein